MRCPRWSPEPVEVEVGVALREFEFTARFRITPAGDDGPEAVGVWSDRRGGWVIPTPRLAHALETMANRNTFVFNTIILAADRAWEVQKQEWEDGWGDWEYERRRDAGTLPGGEA